MSTKKQQKKKDKKKKGGLRKLRSLILTIGFTIVSGLLVYPSFTNALNDAAQTTKIGGYESDVGKYEKAQLEAIRKAAVEYNEKVYEKQKAATWYFQGYDALVDEYESLLKVSESSRIMGFIEIPKINIYLPVIHGTMYPDLEYQVGHMYGSSLPIGGTNTHSIIAGHTGLEKTNLFTNIKDLQKGDPIYIHVLDEIHVYKVCDSHVVLPKACTPYLQIQDNRDLITLYTCTPYGVNSHRLLVAAQRVYPDLTAETAKGTVKTSRRLFWKAIFICIILALIPLTILIVGLYKTFKRNKKKNTKTQKKSKNQNNESSEKPLTINEEGGKEENSSETK